MTIARLRPADAGQSATMADLEWHDRQLPVHHCMARRVRLWAWQSTVRTRRDPESVKLGVFHREPGDSTLTMMKDMPTPARNSDPAALPTARCLLSVKAVGFNKTAEPTQPLSRPLPPQFNSAGSLRWLRPMSDLPTVDSREEADTVAKQAR
ncbi:hypothetical protein DPEC_G00364080 [Dallia pectoralis]|nr:hypothetical protein DPEC_G00364080 [Dallia pectoralis]